MAFTSLILTLAAGQVDAGHNLGSTASTCSRIVIANAANLKKPEAQVGHKSSAGDRRLLHAVFGEPGAALLESMSSLAAAQPDVVSDVEILQELLQGISTCILKKLELKMPRQLDSRDSQAPVLLNATYGTLHGDRADVRWLLQPMVYDGVLRIPTGYPFANLVGSVPKSIEVRRASFLHATDVDKQMVLRVSARVRTTEPLVFTSIPVDEHGHLTKQLYLSSAMPSTVVPFNQSDFANILSNHVDRRRGIEIGGPTLTFEDIYRRSYAVDLANFAAETMWGHFEDRTTFLYPRGGNGTVYITDGSTLNRIEDGKYDFVMGSHYLEHLLNPLKALGAMRRVLKEDGVVILILPRKEECFDHLRGYGRLEEIMYRYLHDVSESDMRHARVDVVTLQSDLARDPPAGTWEQFRARCLRNVANRGIHQFVYNFELLERMGRLLGFEVLFLGTKGLDQWIVLQKTKRHRI